MEKKHLKGLELHSEAVQEILGRPPKWLIRSGITIITAVVAILLIGCRFIKFPEILQATITINADHLPAQIKARSSGRIDTLFVIEGDVVQAGSPLAIIENPANYEDVLLLKDVVLKDKLDSLCMVTHNLQLGNIQDSYLSYLQASNDLRFFVEKDYATELIVSRKKQIEVLEETLLNLGERNRVSADQLALAKERFDIDSILFSEKAIAKTAYNESKKAFMQQRMSHQSLLNEYDNVKLSLLQSRQAVTELEQNKTEQLNAFDIRLKIARNQLETRIRQWEQDYLLTSPVEGAVALTKYWQRNQNIVSGEVMMSIVPIEASSYFGKLYLSQQGAGKVKTGQKVNIKLNDYPYMEFGFVQVNLSSISLVPYSDATLGNVYALEVGFPDSLITQYGTYIPYRPEMTGIAEIITEDLTVLDRLINPIKAVLKR